MSDADKGQLPTTLPLPCNCEFIGSDTHLFNLPARGDQVFLKEVKVWYCRDCGDIISIKNTK